MSKHETFNVDDPFDVLDPVKEAQDPFAGLDSSQVENNQDPFAGLASTFERSAEGADGGLAAFQTPDDRGFFRPPMGEFEATEADWVDKLKLAGGMLFTFDESDQIDLIKATLPDANIRIDEGGNAIASYKGEEGFVNKPGVSWRDFSSVAGILLAFTPAFRAASLATTIAGKVALVGAANAITDVAMQETVKLLGGEKQIDVERALIAGVIGGGGIAVVDKVAKIVAPLIKARGVKKAKEIVTDIGIRTRRNELQRMNPEEAFDEALRELRLSTAEAVAISSKAGTPFAAATKEAVLAFDAKIMQRAKKALKEAPFIKGGVDIANKLLVPIHTNIAKMAPKLGSGVRKMQHDVHDELARTNRQVDGFVSGMQTLRKQSPQLHEQIKTALVRGDEDSFNVLAKEAGASVKDFKLNSEDMRLVLDDMKEYLESVNGVSSTIKDFFFPRIVKDYTKLATVLTGEEYGAITTAVIRAEKKVGKYGKELDALEITDIINAEMVKVGKGLGTRSRTSNARTMTNIQEDLIGQYMDPDEVLQLYLNNTINKKHKQLFVSAFTSRKRANQDAVVKAVNAAKGDKRTIDAIQKESNAMGIDPIPFEQDTTTSIIDMVKQEIILGRVKATNEGPLVSLLDSVLNTGQNVPHAFVQDTKNVFYAATLGNPLAALTQFGDVAVSGIINGFADTIAGAARVLSRNPNKVTVSDIAVATDRVSEEMVSTTRSTAKFLNQMLKLSGFQKIDRFGKEVFVNAAKRRIERQVTTSRGVSDFRDKYKNSFTQEELHQTIESFKSGTVDGNVKFVLWNELSDVQPLTMLEMPEAYLNNPNGRIFYMLKTFTLKQLDIMRRTALDDIAAGRVSKGAKQLAIHNGALVAAGVSVDTIKDLIRGRDTDMGDKMVSQFLRNLGTSQGFTNDIASGNVSKALTNIVMPPVSVADTAFKDIANVGQSFNSMKNVPLVGALLYNWFGGGIEESNDRLRRRQKEQRRNDR